MAVVALRRARPRVSMTKPLGASPGSPVYNIGENGFAQVRQARKVKAHYVLRERCTFARNKRQ